MDEEKLDSNANFIKNVEKILISALSFVSALAWNSAFQNLFERNKYFNKGGPWIYAICVTIITLLLIFGINKLDIFLS
jgi:hypothetical protein|tara:strand:- start:160 stop:393 length:234 start_codon:yes stop_codon:yes gene_type:complete